jgi:hypothetical protein
MAANARGSLYVIPEIAQPKAVDSATAVADTAVQIVYAGIPAQPIPGSPLGNPARSIAIRALHWSYSDTPTAGGVLVTSAGITIFALGIAAAGHGSVEVGFQGFPGQDLTVTLAAGGSGVIGCLNTLGSWAA